MKLRTQIAGWALLAAWLLAAGAAAQQIAPSQIKPGTNGQTMQTIGGVTAWGSGSSGGSGLQCNPLAMQCYLICGSQCYHGWFDLNTIPTTITVTGGSCNGTTCTASTTSSLTSSDWVLLGDGAGALVPSCLHVAIPQVMSSVPGTSFTFAESDTNCTGTQTITGGTAYLADLMLAPLLNKEAFSNGYGSVRVVPEPTFQENISGVITNYTTILHRVSPAVTGKPTLLFESFGALDLQATCVDLSYLEETGGHTGQGFPTLWNLEHADSFKTGTLTDWPVGIGSCSNGAGSLHALNQWINFQKCTNVTLSGACTDYVFDTASKITDNSNFNNVNALGTGYLYVDATHLNGGGNGVVADTTALGMATANSITNLDGPSTGPNIFSGAQTDNIPNANNCGWTLTANGVTQNTCWGIATDGSMDLFGSSEWTMRLNGTLSGSNAPPKVTIGSSTIFGWTDTNGSSYPSVNPIDTGFCRESAGRASATTLGSACNALAGLDAASYNVAGSPIASKNLADFAPTAPTNGQVPVYNIGTHKYTPGTVSGTGTPVNVNGGTTLSVQSQTGVIPESCNYDGASTSAFTCSIPDIATLQTSNCFIFSTAVSNVGTSATIALNGGSAIPIALPSATGWSTTLATGAIPTVKPQLMCYDGTNFDDMQNGSNGVAGLEYDFVYTGCDVIAGSTAYCTGTLDFTSSSASPRFSAMPDNTYIPVCTPSLPDAASNESAGQNFSFNITSALTTTGFSYAVGASVGAPSNNHQTYLFCHLKRGSGGGSGGVAYYQTVQANGTSETQEPKLNLKSGTNATVSCVDNSGASSTDCTVSATGGGSGGFAQISQTVISGTDTNSVTITVPSGYTNLRLIVTANTTYSTFDPLSAVFNSDTTGADYACNLYPNGTGATACTVTGSNFSYMMTTLPTVSQPSATTCEINGYLSSTYYKPMTCNGIYYNGSTPTSIASYSYWNSTAAITSITVELLHGNFTSGSIITLYGEQ